jgi:cobaltochelatase CobS
MSADKQAILALLQQMSEALMKDDDTVSRADVEALVTRVDAAEKAHADLAARTPITHAVKVNDLPAVEVKGRPHPMLTDVLFNASIGYYPLLIGPSGSGKTTLAEHVAEALGLEFSYINLTAGASETWLFGRQTPTGFVEGPFSKRYRDGGVFLADEFDAADANLLLSLNTALTAKAMLNPINGELIPKHEKFVFMAASNTNGKGATAVFNGRNPLDAASLERVVTLGVDYDSDLERDVCGDEALYGYLTKVRAALQERQLKEFVSTRKFVVLATQIKRGWSFEKALNALIFTWSDTARRAALDLVDVYHDAVASAEGDDGTDDETPGADGQPTVKRGRGRPRKYPLPATSGVRG